MKEKVSVVLCVKNVEQDLEECLVSIKKNKYFEIIIVDGNSKDNTVQIAEKIGVDKIISDEGKGLSYARKLGVDNASGDQVLFFGPDNIMDSNFIEKFATIKKEYGFDVASVQTRVYNPVTFWDFGLDFKWLCIMGKPGRPIKVAGTPSLYSKSVFKIATFSTEDLGPNDDTQISQTLIEGKQKIGLIPLSVYDKNGWTFKASYGRYKWYGLGDFYFYRKNRSNWTLKRKISSITHPLRQMFGYMFKAMLRLRLDAMVWLFLMTFARYHGWIEILIKKKK